MSSVNAPIEGAVMIGGTVGTGGVAFSSGPLHVVGKSSPVRIAHCGDYATVYDDVIRTEGEPGAAEDIYMPGMDGIISVTGYASKVWAGNMSRTSALGDESEIELSYMTEPSAPDYGLTMSKAYIAGHASRIVARQIVQDSVLIASGDNSLIHDEGHHNTVVCTGNEADITAGNHAVIIVTRQKCSFTFGVGSVAIFCWKDEDDQNVIIIREGEKGISAGTPYLFEKGDVRPL